MSFEFSIAIELSKTLSYVPVLFVFPVSGIFFNEHVSHQDRIVTLSFT